MTSEDLICVFWPHDGWRTFLARNGQLQGEKIKRPRASLKLKLENYESVEHVLSFFEIKKRSKISFLRHFKEGRMLYCCHHDIFFKLRACSKNLNL